MANIIVCAHEHQGAVDEVCVVSGSTRQLMKKADVLKALLAGVVFKTIDNDGPRVRAVPTIKPEYLRTDTNDDLSDDLGWLPAFNECEQCALILKNRAESS